MEKIFYALGVMFITVFVIQSFKRNLKKFWIKLFGLNVRIETYPPEEKRGTVCDKYRGL